MSRSALDRYHDQLKGLGMRLEGRLRASMGTLSGGQRQAVTLLMATLRRPRLLLLDEHTAALDPRAWIRPSSRVDRTIMVHRGEILADLSGNEREGLDANDLLRKFTELRYTVEFAVTNRPPV